jgi:hypothetical protein
MSYSSQSLTSPTIRLPHFAMPKPRWPRLGARGHAVLMLALMISPAFLSDYIGYGVKRLSYTAAQIAEMRAPGDTILAHIEIFPVACTDPASPGPEQRWWTAHAAQQGWPMYPQAGDTCFRPDRSLLGVVGLKTFNVACPTIVLTVADRREWTSYAADHGWDAYPQAGADCVDP